MGWKSWLHTACRVNYINGLQPACSSALLEARLCFFASAATMAGEHAIVPADHHAALQLALADKDFGKTWKSVRVSAARIEAQAT